MKTTLARSALVASMALVASVGCSGLRTPARRGRDDAGAVDRGGPASVNGQRNAPASAVATSARTPAVDASATPPVDPTAEASALSAAFTSAAKAIRPSVVRLDVEMSPSVVAPAARQGDEPDVPDFLKRFFDLDDTPTPFGQRHGTGSGVIIDVAGHILTNNHVVEGATRVSIQLVDGRTFAGKVIGADPLTDVGVVRFEKPVAGLTAARLADSDKLRIGEWAMAVGSPLGMDQTVTVGIISGVGKTGRSFRFESGERVDEYIATDAKINPGNSGGPLLNLDGDVVGINTLINIGPGGSYGFAIPINQAHQVASALLAEGRVRYPYIGVTVVDLDDAARGQLEKAGAKPPKSGALVAAVAPGGPAAEAGIASGDVIVSVAGAQVDTGDDVVARVAERKIGETIAVGIVRGAKQRSMSVKVAELPRPKVAAAAEAHLGVALQNLTARVASELGLDRAVKGAVVTNVEPRSAAERAGLMPGDVIREVDRTPVASADDAAQALRARKGSHLVRVTRGKQTQYVMLSPTS